MNHEEKDLNSGNINESVSQEETIIDEQTSDENTTDQGEAMELLDPIEESESPGPAFLRKPLPASTIILSVLCITLATVLLLTQFGVIGTIRKSSAAAQSGWLSTPEESIRFFVESVRDNRFDSALAAFTAEEIAPEAQFALQLERVGSYNPLMQYNLPEQYPTYSPVILAVAQGKSAGSTLQFAGSLLLGESYMEQTLFSSETEVAKQEIAAIATQLNPERLKGLTFVRADAIDSEYQNSEEYRSFILERVSAFGYDSYIEYMALVKLDDSFYVAMFAMVSDNGKWKIYEMNSGLLQFSYSIAVPITEEDYISMI